jgi:asparagine synthase (glutamine-hydrolysing)
LSALAGVVSPRPSPARERTCLESIGAQQRYGRDPVRIREVADATFAISNFQTGIDPGRSLITRDSPSLLAMADITLHNRPDLIATLAPGTGVGSHSNDTELFVGAWLQWGEGCFDRLVGDYAIALYEPGRRRLVLARDPIGERTLFYWRDGAVTQFASMPSGLFGSNRPRPDLPRLARRLAGQEDFGPATWFEGIQRVLPGELLVVTPDAIHRRLHWQPQVEERVSANRAELIETYRALLDESVRCRIADQSGPIASQLSAGYDSSAVTATAARQRKPGQRLIAFTNAPFGEVPDLAARGRFADESGIAAATAASLGIEHRVVRLGEPLLAPVREFVRSHQSIATPVANVGWWLQIRDLAAASGAQVLLTGELGNYGLSIGGLPALREWVRRRQWRRWFAEARAVVARGDVRWRGLLFASFSPWLPRPAADLIVKLALQGAAADDRFIFVRPELVGADAPIRPWPAPARGNFSADCLEIIRTDDPGMMRKGSLAQSGIEERSPTVDRRLVEFCLRLPPEQMLDRGVYKPLARAALADRLPPAVLDAKDRGLQGTDWPLRFSAADARAALEEIQASSTAGELIDLAKLRRAIDRWPAAGTVSEPALATFGMNMGMALATGIFLLELQRNPELFGR